MKPAVVLLIFAGGCVAAQVQATPRRSAPQRRMVKPSELRGLKGEYETLFLEKQFNSGSRLLIRSSDAGPGWATLGLYGPTGKLLEKLETRGVEGVRLIERQDRPPFVEVRTEAHGTGAKQHNLTWYCVDHNKLEPVFDLTETSYYYDYSDPHPIKGAARIEHEASEVRLVMPAGYYFRYPAWPIVRVRTTTTSRYETDSGKEVRDDGARVSLAQYEFDPKRREYRATSTRIVSDTISQRTARSH